jgi:trehalose-6-phosphate synthase
MTIELSRRIQTESSRTARIDARIHLDAKLSQGQKQGILQAADRCHITESIREGMQIVCSLAEAKVNNV